MTDNSWLARAREMVDEGYCPNDLGVHLEPTGWCPQCRCRYRLRSDGWLIVEHAWDD